MEDLENYEHEYKRIQKQNEQLLQEFQQSLIEKNLSNKTINKHTNNVEFYINEFLLYDEPIEAKDGALAIGEFLGYWFIKKAMWATASQINENAASLKKFYTFLNEKGCIGKETLEMLFTVIKEEKPKWIARLKRYDDTSIYDMEEVWDLSMNSINLNCIIQYE